MKIAYQDFLDTISVYENQQLPFVAYRFPNERELHLISQNDETLHSAVSERKGFVMHSFSGDSSFLISAENYFISEMLLESEKLDFQKVSSFKIDRKRHLHLVKKAISSIEKSDFQKVVLSQKVKIPISEKNLSEYFERLIFSYPSAFCYVVFHPKIGKWMAATPEILLKNVGNQIETMSLAGTQKVQLNLPVQWQNKEMEEQRIVTQVIINELEPFVESLSVSDPQTLQAGNLWHLCTNIKGELLKEYSVNQILKVLHPTPAVCGFPTEKAKQFILENENYDREFYTGYCGLLRFPNEDENYFFVNLRCMQIVDNQSYIYVGGGITKDSNPEAECQELENKAQTMLKILFS